MATGRFVAYYRVSTAEQGRSGLGLEAQRAAVRAYLDGGHWTLLGEFTEVESGKVNDRPQLAAALTQARLTAATLIIAKLDRLSRDAHFLLGLEKAGVDFVAADMPGANRLTVRLMAVIAQEEREMISARTKAALQAAKARGTKLGGWRPTRKDGSPRDLVDPRLASAAASRRANEFAARVGPTVAELHAKGLSLHGIARELTAQGIVTRRGGTWTSNTVKRVLARVAGSPA